MNLMQKLILNTIFQQNKNNSLNLKNMYIYTLQTIIYVIFFNQMNTYITKNKDIRLF